MATVFHWSNNKLCYKTIKDNQFELIDANADNSAFCHDEPSADTKIRIYLATFGGSDVTDILRNESKKKDFSSVSATINEFGNVLPGWNNVLYVYYSIGNSYITRIVSQGGKITFLEELENAKLEEEDRKKKIQQAIEDAKKAKQNQKYEFSLAGLSYGPTDYTLFQANKVIDNRIILRSNSAYFGDPFVGYVKTMHLFYFKRQEICVYNSIERTNVLVDINIDNSPGSCHKQPDITFNDSVNVYAASYGLMDVTEQMRKLFSQSKLTSYEPNLSDFGKNEQTINDGLTKRSFSIYFKINGIFFFAVLMKGDSIDFIKIYEKWQKEHLKESTQNHPEIIAANYATLNTTDRVRKIISLATTSKVSFIANDNNFGNPSPFFLKTAGVIYQTKNKYCVVAALQNEQIVIDESESQCYSPPEPSKVQIYAAIYSGVDVTERLRALSLTKDFNKLTADDKLLNKPLDSRYLRTLLIYYAIDGHFF